MADDQNENQAAARALRRIMAAYDRCRRVVAERYGVTVADIIAMADLYQYGPQTPRTIADRLAWTTGGVTALLDRLERSGYVTRSPNPADRRSLMIQLTDQGEDAMQWAFALLQTAIDEAPHPDISTTQLTVSLDDIAISLNRQADNVEQQSQ